MVENNKEETLSNDIKIVPIVKEMQTSFLDYAMSVIVSRALPDIRDGLKPVHRRILYAMKDLGCNFGTPFKKSARIVGDVIGKYHPHGDTAVYESMVRMGQDWSLAVPLVNGQGNYGSIDGDSPAAMRYTEARLAKVASSLLDDLDKDTIDWRTNYDESLKEPEVLPAKFPNLLVNGTAGIAVGMATNIPPHNLGEVLDGCLAFIENPELSSEELMEYIPGPDFPTGGIILGKSGSRKALTTGRGSIIMRSKTHFEEIRSKQAIIITEIPYQVNKKVLIEKTIELVKDKKIEGISDIRDESDRHGIRVVMELKRDVVPEIVLNMLFKYTQLQTSFGANMLAIHKGKPESLDLQKIIKAFIEFREEVIRRRTIFELNKARTRAHNLAGLITAVANLDEVIKIIRSSRDTESAKVSLMSKNWPAHEIEAFIKLIDDPENEVLDSHYMLSEQQAKAILDLRLNKLTGLEREKLQNEIAEISEFINAQLFILSNREKMFDIMKEEIAEVREKFAIPRRSEMTENEFEADIEDLIAKEDVVVSMTNTGYIKRVPLDTYRAQRRGGKGRKGMETKDEDFVTNVFVANTHTPLLMFSNKGIAYKLKVYKLPVGGPATKGKALINLLPLEQGEYITTVMPMPEDENKWEELSIMFATSRGTVRRNRLSDFISVRANGKIAMKLEGETDELVGVATCEEDKDVLLSLEGGKCIRFPVPEVRVFNSRNSMGVRGIKLNDGDKIISMAIINHTDADPETRAAYLKKSKALRGLEGSEELDGEDTIETNIEISENTYQQLEEQEQFLLSITDTGFGKRTSSFEYRTTHRGGSGIANMKLGAKSNHIVASFPIEEDQQIILITDAGKIIRMPIKNVRIAGRQTMGVTLFKVADNEKVISATLVDAEDDEEIVDDSENTNIETPSENSDSTENNEVEASIEE